ncbi:MAG: fimbrillin family protein [Tannerellaceae bacterium]|nr:fimbrillin family protein [Tannerellaceae bacterium]
MTLTLPGYITGGSFNNGVFIPGSTPGNITVAKNVGEDGTSAIAHIQPQTVDAGTTVITIQSPNGRIYTATYSDPVIYEAGQSTTLRIDLMKTDVTLSVTVIDWTEKTVSMVATSITLNSDLGSTDSDFQDKSIYVFGLDQQSDYTLFTYKDSDTGY